MIVETRRAGNLEVRGFGDELARIPRPTSLYATSSGRMVTRDSATGLPAFGRAIRYVAGIVGMLCPVRTFEGRGGDRVERSASELGALLERPVLGLSVFEWGYDIAVALEATENAFLAKRKDSAGRVVELVPIPPDYVNARLERGRKRYSIRTAGGLVELDDEAILHIRGHTVDGGPFGVSRITQHRDAVAAQEAALEFEGRFYRNDARPGVAFVFPVGVTQKQASAYKREIEQEYGGVENSWRPFVVGGGVTVSPIPVSLRDAQHVEGRQYGVGDAGRIMDVDPVLLGAGEGDLAAVTSSWLSFSMQPRLSRITAALDADPELYGLSSLYPSFELDPERFLDPETRANVQHAQIQDGTLLVDEARASYGRPPLPDGLGQVPLLIPVGAGANAIPSSSSSDDDDDGEQA